MCAIFSTAARWLWARSVAKSEDGVRLLAVRTLTAVIADGKSLADMLPKAQQSLDTRGAAFLQELSFGSMRWSFRLDALLMRLLNKPLRNRDADVRVALWLGLYEAEYMRTPDYAVADSYVRLAKKLGKPWARGLINATIRKYFREREALLASLERDRVAMTAHPEWLLDLLVADWPDQWQEIVAAGNARAPLTLRTNRRRQDRVQMINALTGAGIDARAHELASDAIQITGNAQIDKLPGYASGHFSVQDAAAQLAAQLLAVEPGQRVLDACAAPGGKSGHILELQPTAKLLALDSSASRLERVTENLARLGHDAKTVCADAADPSAWWDGEPFDRILLDAPCSALGVLRRHPDIRRLRRDSDIAALTDLQLELVQALWPLLSAGGRMLYATCSVLRCENEQVIARFLDATDDARELPLLDAWGYSCQHGRQILPCQHEADGFYYAILEKV